MKNNRKTNNNYKIIKLFVFLLIILFMNVILVIKSADIQYFIFSHIYKYASNCNDGIKNQDEEGIDCGGVCHKCKDDSYNDIIWGSVDIIKTGDNQYTMAAYVDNPNSEMGAGSFEYSFSLYDSNYDLFRKIEGYNFIYPSQTKYIVENILNVDKEICRVKFDMYNFDLKKFDYNESMPDISFSDSEFEFKDNNVAEFSAIAYNRSKNDFNNISATVIIYNKNNEIILAESVDIGEIKHNNIKFCKIVWYDIYDISDQIEYINVKFYVSQPSI